MNDIGLNVQEAFDTLLMQQFRLLVGARPVQMFPTGTKELPLPPGFDRVVNDRGVFHYNNEKITAEEILSLSARGRENEFLELGPYSKHDITNRLKAGELFTCVSEYTPEGVEVRTAAATNKTVAEIETYFERTKQTGNTVFCGALPPRVQEQLKGEH